MTELTELEELNDPKKLDDLMENINTKLAIIGVPLRERLLMSLTLLSDELNYEISTDDTVYPLISEWFKNRFPGESI
jgi:hypothetical protein